ncbi:MAG: efflux RND transporter periplasmic adaptor subunit [Pirellulales bacterium]
MSYLRGAIVGWWLLIVAVAGVGAWGVLQRKQWVASLHGLKALVTGQERIAPTESMAAAKLEKTVAAPRTLELSPQAQRNLRLVVRPVKLETYWKSLLMPGEIVDRPGVSDRGVTSPAIGVISRVHAFPGDTVRPGDRLFSLRLISEYVQNTQSELFQATREIELLGEQRERLAKAAEGGAIAQSRLIEVEQQLRRQQAVVQGYRQDLLARGLRPEQLQEVAEGRFVSSIELLVPVARGSISDQRAGDAEARDARESNELAVGDAQSSTESNDVDVKVPTYEVQELRVDLGAQVQAGQLLGVLSDHRALFVKGHAFKREAPQLEQAAQRGWPVQIEFAEDDPAGWPVLNQKFQIRHLANTIDANSRTLDFFIPLENQSHSYEKDGRTFVVWRFRPGQRLRLHVPVEEFRDVIVLPAGAVVREGPEAYVFRQNGELFDRRPVRVLHEDRLHVVIAHDGSIAPGWFIAQNGAASLNRVLKSQSASGVPVGFHVHADGTVHGAH